MAMVAQRFGMTISFVDNGGNQVTREYMMSSSVATYTDAAAAAAAMYPLVNTITAATIPQYRVFQVFEDNAFVLPADMGVQVENQASMTFLLAGIGSKKGNLNIPAPTSGIFVATSGPNANIVDIADAGVEAWADMFLAAGDFRLSDNEASSRLLQGRRVHRRSSKG